MCRETVMNNKLVQSMALSLFTGLLVSLTGCGGGGGDAAAAAEGSSREDGDEETKGAAFDP